MNKNDFRDFFAKNFRVHHILGIILGCVFSFIYWLKSGRFSDYVLKNNIYLILFWGAIIGYISFDLIFSSSKKLKNDDDKN